MAANFEREWPSGRDKLSEQLRALIERGREVRAVDYQRALRRIAPVVESFDELFMRALRRDPHAAGARHRAEGARRRPAIRRSARCGRCSACRRSSLPLMQGENGLPLGVQLVGRRNFDARLLRTARWLASAESPARAQRATSATRPRRAAARPRCGRRTRPPSASGGRRRRARAPSAISTWRAAPSLRQARRACQRAPRLGEQPLQQRLIAAEQQRGERLAERLARAQAEERVERRVDVDDAARSATRASSSASGTPQAPARRATARCRPAAGTARARVWAGQA